MLPPSASLDVLLIEGDPLLQQVLTSWLESLRYGVTVARNLGEARAQLAAAPFDMVLTDVSLPDGSGLDVLELIAAPPAPPLVIVITADSSAQTVIEALRRGAFDYLTKPVNVDLLRRSVERAVAHITYRRAAEELARLRAQEEAMQVTARAAVHHLSQDLTVIMGEAQLLEEDLADPGQLASLRRIVKAVTSAASKLSTLRQARRFGTADSREGDAMLDLDAASRPHS